MKNIRYARIDDETHKTLKQIAKKEGRTVGGLVRVIVVFYKEWKGKMETFIHESSR